MQNWLITPETDMDLVAAAAGKTYYLDKDEEQHFTGQFLDDFEHRIARGGSALLRSPGKLEWRQDGDSRRFKQRKKPAFVADIDDPVLAGLLDRVIDVRKLNTVGKAVITSQHMALRDGEDKAVAWLEIARTGMRRMVSVKPVRGYEKPVAAVIRALEAAGAMQSPADIGQYALEQSGFVATDYTLKPKFGFTPDMPVGKAVSHMGTVMLTIARENETGMVEDVDDIEYLHHYRVCLRKVRSAISLIKEIWPEEDQQKLKTRLGDLARRTNELRDLDVWMQERDYYDSLLPDSLRSGLPVMFAHFEKQHGAAKSRVARWINSASYKTEISDLVALFEDEEKAQQSKTGKRAMKPLVQKKILKRYQKIVTLGTAITPETPDDDVHELRIECKKLRYLLEFFKEVFDPASMKKLLKKLKRLQDNLGLFNDYSVQQESLLSFLENHNSDVKVAGTVGALVAELDRRQKEQRSHVEENFTMFADTETAALITGLTALNKKEKP